MQLNEPMRPIEPSVGPTTSPRRNRVDPFGDVHAVSPRGLLTGNRGCLVDDHEQVVRHHRGSLWITCLTSYRGWRHPLAAPRVWTPLFFLDDAVALAAGHRPCGLCRTAAYRSYRDAIDADLRATDLNRMLQRERLWRGRGVDRGRDRKLWRAPLRDLPTGAVVVTDDQARLVVGDRLLAFSFTGWVDPISRSRTGRVAVLTPASSIAALRGGFEPMLHPSVTVAHGAARIRRR